MLLRAPFGSEKISKGRQLERGLLTSALQDVPLVEFMHLEFTRLPGESQVFVVGFVRHLLITS